MNVPLLQEFQSHLQELDESHLWKIWTLWIQHPVFPYVVQQILPREMMTSHLHRKFYPMHLQSTKKEKKSIFFQLFSHFFFYSIGVTFWNFLPNVWSRHTVLEGLRSRKAKITMYNFIGQKKWGVTFYEKNS